MTFISHFPFPPILFPDDYPLQLSCGTPPWCGVSTAICATSPMKLSGIIPTVREGSSTASSVRSQRRSNVIASVWEQRCGFRGALTRFARTHLKQDVAAETEHRERREEASSTPRCDRDRWANTMSAAAEGKQKKQTGGVPMRQPTAGRSWRLLPLTWRHSAPPRHRTVCRHWKPTKKKKKKASIAEILHIPSADLESDNGESGRLLCEGCVEVSLPTTSVCWKCADLSRPHCVCASGRSIKRIPHTYISFTPSSTPQCLSLLIVAYTACYTATEGERASHLVC